MSNGNNNGHHGNGTGNGLVQVNGNGHKPDAAIVSEHDPASSAGLALLWDGLPPAVTQTLWGSPSTPAWFPSARGAGAGSSTTSKATPSSTRPTRIFGSWRLGIRLGRRRDPAPDRDGRYEHR